MLKIHMQGKLYQTVQQRLKEGKEVEQKEYAREFGLGYSFGTNCYCDQIDQYKDIYKKRGFDIIVKDIAFDIVGKRLDGHKAVLVRKNS